MNLKLILAALSLLNFASAQCTFDGCLCVYNADNSQNIYCTGGNSATAFPKRTGVNDSLLIKTLTFENYNVPRLTNIFANLAIDKLQLTQNKLSAIAGNAFSGIRSLKQLSIQDFTLKNNTLEFGSLDPIATTLTSLEISSSGLTYEKFSGFYSEVFKLTKLTDLNLNANDLNKFDAKWAPVSLRNLNLALNNLGDLDLAVFQKLTQLRVLDLSQNHFSDLTSLLTTIRASLVNSLKELYLRGNSIQTVPVFPPLSLLRLDLSENQIQALDATPFANLLSLTDILLNNNQIRTVDPLTFASNEKLVTIQMANNYVSKVPSILKQSSLQLLDLTNQNGQLVSLADNSFDRVLASTNTLNVNLKSNPIATFSPKAFCSSFSSSPSIGNLQLSSVAALNANKCLLKQLSQVKLATDVTLTVQQENGVNYSNLCSCALKLFYNSYQMKLTEACDPSISGCGTTVVDDCASKTEFICSSSGSSTTPTATSIVSTATAIVTTATSTASTDNTFATGLITRTITPFLVTTTTTINYNKNAASIIKARPGMSLFFINLVLFGSRFFMHGHF